MNLKFVNSILINSADRNLGNNLNNFSISKNTNTSGYDYLGVFSFQMVNNIYPVNEYNNSLTVVNGPNTGTLTIATATYTPSSLVIELLAKLNGLGFPSVWGVTYSSATSKITITSDVNGIILAGSFAPVIGMKQSQAVAGLTITGQNPINIKYSSFLSITSTALTQFNAPSIRTDQKAGHIVYNVPVNNYNFGDTIYQEPRHMSLFKCDRSQIINELDFSVIDEFGNLAPMNNSEFQIVMYGYKDITYDNL